MVRKSSRACPRPTSYADELSEDGNNEAAVETRQDSTSSSLFSQDEDEHIRKLDQSGALSHVIGSQSMLSQELVHEKGVIDAPAAAAMSTLLTTSTQDDGDEENNQPSSQQSEAPVSSSQLSFLMRAARELDEGDNASYDTVPKKKKRKKVAAKVSTVPVESPAPLNPNDMKYLTQKERRKAEKEAEQAKTRALAQQAAELAARVVASPEVSKRLLLSMVFVRENPRSPPATWAPRGSVIPEGFFWATYPPLEIKLKQYMKQYYELSVTKCQSKEQQGFNNDMVVIMRAEATRFGWTFDACFTDKILRDRIRCYFKTHIQNARKRLRTMLMNPTKKANANHLIQHLDIINRHSKEGDDDSSDEEAEMDPDTQEAVNHVMSLGFARLSQDAEAVAPTQQESV